MFVYKNQPRQHLKHDVPNFIFWEHLVLSRLEAKRQKREQRGNKIEQREIVKSAFVVDVWTRGSGLGGKTPAAVNLCELQM